MRYLNHTPRLRESLMCTLFIAFVCVACSSGAVHRKGAGEMHEDEKSFASVPASSGCPHFDPSGCGRCEATLILLRTSTCTVTTPSRSTMVFFGGSGRMTEPPTRQLVAWCVSRPRAMVKLASTRWSKPTRPLVASRGAVKQLILAKR